LLLVLEYRQIQLISISIIVQWLKTEVTKALAPPTARRKLPPDEIRLDVSTLSANQRQSAA
jgi:hypothetical protein